MPPKRAVIDPDLPMDPATGATYHLPCKSNELADHIIFVGDPGRVPVVAERFDKNTVEFDKAHREIRVITGMYHGVRVSVLSTGMGTDNCEIIINEIHALKEFDLAKGEWKSADRRPGHGKNPNVVIIRVGTCGTPLPEVPLGTLAISRHAIGMDNTCQFYVREPNESAVKLQALVDKTELGKKIQTYTSMAHPDVTAALVAESSKKPISKNRGFVVGTTASASGFYACQGRPVGQFRGRLALPNLVEILAKIRIPVPGAKPEASEPKKGKKRGREEKEEEGPTEPVVNIEMENSAVCCLTGMLGYKAGTICAIIARRAGELREFATSDNITATITDAITVGLNALVSIPQEEVAKIDGPTALCVFVVLAPSLF